MGKSCHTLVSFASVSLVYTILGENGGPRIVNSGVWGRGETAFLAEINYLSL